MSTKPCFHFFASSVANWATTSPTRDLRALIKLMEDDGHGYTLFLVPVAHDAPYEIDMYQPKVEGRQWLGYFHIKAAS